MRGDHRTLTDEGRESGHDFRGSPWDTERREAGLLRDTEGWGRRLMATIGQH